MKKRKEEINDDRGMHRAVREIVEEAWKAQEKRSMEGRILLDDRGEKKALVEFQRQLQEEREKRRKERDSGKQ